MSIHYSKELAKQLGKIAVYLPGSPLEVGDIIKFPHGNSFLGKSRPLGVFRKVSSLHSLGVIYVDPSYSNSPDPIQYASENAVEFNFDIGAGADLGNSNLPSGDGTVRISFSSENAIYFLGVGCDTKQLDDIIALEKAVNDKKNSRLLWEDTYLVTAVTIAKKAFIAQSRSKTSELIVQGKVQGINTKSVNINAETNLSIKKQKGNVFVKDWSDNVTIFMDLVKFEKNVFGSGNYRSEKVAINKSKEANFNLQLKPVLIEELLTD